MNFVQLRSFDNYLHAHMQLSILREEGINCYLKDEYTITIDPLLSPAIGGMKLMVYASQSERASAIMDASDKEYLATVACPQCGQHSLVWKRIVHRPEGLWQRWKGILLYGQAETVETFYSCTSCQSRFEELP